MTKDAPGILPIHVDPIRPQLLHHPGHIPRPPLPRLLVPRSDVEAYRVSPATHGNDELGARVEFIPQVIGRSENGPLLGRLILVEEVGIEESEGDVGNMFGEAVFRHHGMLSGNHAGKKKCVFQYIVGR